MDWQYYLKSPRPCLMPHLHAAVWSTFRFFLARADAFTLECGAWGQEELVQPMLELGYHAESSPTARWLCRLSGPLTPETCQALLGPGEGEFPWWSLELYRDGRPIYYILEHEHDVFWNCTPEDLQALCLSLEPMLVGEFAQRHLPEPAEVGASRLAAALTRRSGIQVEEQRLLCFDSRCFVDITTDAGRGLIRLDSDAAAAIMVTDDQAAEAVAAQLDPPLTSGDYVRLSLGDGAPFLSRMPPALWPRRRQFSHHLNRPTRADWRRSVAVLARRATRFALRWQEGSSPGSEWPSRLSRWVIAAGLDVDRQGGVEEIVGSLSPQALHLLLTELPPTEPHVELLLLAGPEVIWQSDQQGAFLSPTPAEAALLDRPRGRLVDLSAAQMTLQRLGKTWIAMVRAADRLATSKGDPEFYQYRSVAHRYYEIRYQGRVVFTLTIEPDALEQLAAHPDPAALITGAPGCGHILVETDGNEIRWRTIPVPPVIA